MTSALRALHDLAMLAVAAPALRGCAGLAVRHLARLQPEGDNARVALERDEAAERHVAHARAWAGRRGR